MLSNSLKFQFRFWDSIALQNHKIMLPNMKQREVWTAFLMTSFVPVALRSSEGPGPIFWNLSFLTSVKWKKQRRSKTRASSKTHCPLRNPSSSEFKARDFNEVLQLLWLPGTRLYFAKTRCVIGIGGGLTLPHTWLSETRRNLLNEPYFVLSCTHVFSLGLTHANLSSFISYHIPT